MGAEVRETQLGHCVNGEAGNVLAKRLAVGRGNRVAEGGGEEHAYECCWRRPEGGAAATPASEAGASRGDCRRGDGAVLLSSVILSGEPAAADQEPALVAGKRRLCRE